MQNYTKKQLAIGSGIFDCIPLSNIIFVIFVNHKNVIFPSFLFSDQFLYPALVVKYMLPLYTTKVTGIVD